MNGCLDCCAEPVYENDPIEIIEDFLLAAHPSTKIACLCEAEYGDSWYDRNISKKALNIHHIGLKRLSDILNAEFLHFSQLDTIDVWLGTLANDLADARELACFHSFFRRHRHTLQDVRIHTTGIHEDVVASRALHSQIVDASKCLPNLKAVFIGANGISNQILGTFESALQLRCLRIDFDTLGADFKICAPYLEYLTLIQNDSRVPVKVDLSRMRNLIRVDFRVSNSIGHHLILSSDNRGLRWLRIHGHLKVDGDISKVAVMALFYGNNEQIGGLFGRCNSSLRELQLVGSRDVEIDARVLIRVLDIRGMKNFSLRTSKNRPLDALYIETVEFANPVSPVHVRRVCIVGDQSVEKRFDGTTDVAIIFRYSTPGSFLMPTIVTDNRRSLETLLLSPTVGSPLPELPNIKFLFLPNLEDFIVHATAIGDQLEQVAAFYNGDQQLQDLVRKTVCSNLDLLEASEGLKNAWQYWHSYGGFSSNLWSDSTFI